MRDYTKTIAAGASVTVQLTAKVMTCKTFSAPCVVQFNGGSELDAKSGTVFDRSPMGGFSTVTIINRNAISVDCFFYLGETEVSYSPDGNSTSVVTVDIYGNCGIANGAGASGGKPACDAQGLLQITDAMNFKVAGTLNGQRRLDIVFSVAAASAAPLQVLDSSGRAYMTIQPGQTILRAIDSDLWLSGKGGTASATVGQTFQKS